MSKKSRTPKMLKILKDVAPLAVGEILVSLAVLLGAILLDLLNVIAFNMFIVSGACLGAVVATLNYVFLVCSVDRAIDQFIAIRGDKELDEEEAAKFTSDHSSLVQNAIKISFVVRTFSMGAALVIAFLTGLFNPLATAIPMFAFRPLLTVINVFMRKSDKTPAPAKFVKYDYDNENNDEKESD